MSLISGYAYCSGALLNENLVATSAFCYKNKVIMQLGGQTNTTKQMYVFHNQRPRPLIMRYIGVGGVFNNPIMNNKRLTRNMK